MPESGTASGLFAERVIDASDMGTRTYDPLTVEELGRNAARALMKYAAVPLPPSGARGAGVYTIHYSGSYSVYANVGNDPIYVGQARDVAARLTQHTQSIQQAKNLEIGDFTCRWLILEPIWIGLTETILIEEYRPIWNAIRGFGNHAPGQGRLGQQRSQWDTLHPGRYWAEPLKDLPGGMEGVLAAIREHTGEDG